MSLPEKAFPVSWDQFHRDARALAWRIAGAEQEWRAIVCITRGGLVPAAIVARELNIRLIETVCVASYHDYQNQGDMEVLKKISSDLTASDGEDILIVDDLTDTGKTAELVRSMLPKAHFATVLRKAERPTNGRHFRDRRQPGHLDLFPLGYGIRLSGAYYDRSSQLIRLPTRTSWSLPTRTFRWTAGLVLDNHDFKTHGTSRLIVQLLTIFVVPSEMTDQSNSIHGMTDV